LILTARSQFGNDVRLPAAGASNANRQRSNY
jgi:hypothetical protein